MTRAASRASTQESTLQGVTGADVADALHMVGNLAAVFPTTQVQGSLSGVHMPLWLRLLWMRLDCGLVLVIKLFLHPAEEAVDLGTEQPVPLQPAEEIEGQGEHQAMPSDPAPAADEGTQITNTTQNFLLRRLVTMPHDD